MFIAKVHADDLMEIIDSTSAEELSNIKVIVFDYKMHFLLHLLHTTIWKWFFKDHFTQNIVYWYCHYFWSE